MSLRLFVALPVDRATASVLGSLRRRLEPAAEGAIRWVADDSWHLTLRFLGETPAERLEPLRLGLRAALAPLGSPTLRVAGLGTFPARGAPRVVWAGIEGDVIGLRTLAEAADGAAVRCGFPAEDRPFRAHLTLGRTRRGRRVPVSFAEALAREGDATRLASFAAESVVLFRSELRPGGPRYEALERIVLRGPRAEA